MAKDISELHDKFMALDIPVEYLPFLEKVLLNMEYNKFKIIMDGILEFGFNPNCFDPKMQELIRGYTPSTPVDDMVERTLSELQN